MRIISEPQNSVHVFDMQDGDIAVIIKWDNSPVHAGSIVQRYKNSLLKLGEIWDQGWGEIFASHRSNFDNCQVRILRPGTTIEL